MDTHLRFLASTQADVVASWQLRDAGWSPDRIAHHARRGAWRPVHRGVYLLTSARVRREQLWFAAVLTAPNTVLSHGSAAACWGFHHFERGFEVVSRPGKGGPRRHGSLLVMRSTRLDGDLTRHEGLPITTAARTLLDMAAGLEDKRLRRAFRESIRLRATTSARILECLGRHPRRPGAPRLEAIARRYGSIPYERTRSDPEGHALELLHDAGAEPPLVNVRIAGEEADLAFPARRVIVEVDGPQYHLFREEDSRKTAIWRRAGWDVRRISSDRVYSHPDHLAALATGP